jgi:hypothetical protein
MAGRDASYTHRHWYQEAADIVTALSDVLVPALAHMQADLIAMQAGRAHLATAAGFIEQVGELGREGERVLAAHGPRLARVSETQAQAGGLGEVAADKRYNQR